MLTVAFEIMACLFPAIQNQKANWMGYLTLVGRQGQKDFPCCLNPIRVNWLTI